MEIPDKVFFKIGEVARIVDVEPYVLRYWETEFRIRPKRSAAGQRLYRRENVERFLLIKRLLHTEGFTIAGARRYLARLREKGEGGRKQLEDASVGVTKGAGARSDGEHTAWRGAFLAEIDALRRLIQEARQIEG